MRLPFLKMQALGNDFVLVDARTTPVSLSPAQCVHLADRKRGIGCDQIVVLEPSQNAAVFMRIANADGSASGACGNATRCVAMRIMQETGATETHIETTAGVLVCRAAEEGIAVDMGTPARDWRAIPLCEPRDTLHLALGPWPLADGVAVNVGNPHVVFFVPDLETVALEELGPLVEHDPLFPERVNVGFVHVEAADAIGLRVWERGVGPTEACGTAACAALVASALRGVTGRSATVSQPGGCLRITWDARDHVIMAGRADFVYEGVIDVDA